MGACRFDDLDDIPMAPLGCHVVDAHAARLASPIEVVERPADLAPRFHLRGWRDRILEIAEHMVGSGCRRLLEHLLVAAGYGKLRPAGAVCCFTYYFFLLGGVRRPRVCSDDTHLP